MHPQEGLGKEREEGGEEEEELPLGTLGLHQKSMARTRKVKYYTAPTKVSMLRRILGLQETSEMLLA